uniref:Tetratricopeptide repeat protein n=1 Tax=Ignavibacterium album TaxID=591197 RepID=A0A7V2ZHV3_9BACT
MKKVIAILILLSSIVLPQKFKVEKISGTVRALTTDSENWIELKTGNEIPPNAIVSVEKNSLVKISGREVSVTLTENSAITLSNLKKMSMEDLVLAIAMENILNAPRNNGKNKSQSTAVYGKNEFEKNPVVSNQEFGIKRLNGAKQLAENGLKESAVIAAKEVYRKYPSTKSLSDYRIFFAEILYEKKLYAEALDEYNDIQTLSLSESQKEKVNQRIEEIKRKLAK